MKKSASKLIHMITVTVFLATVAACSKKQVVDDFIGEWRPSVDFDSGLSRNASLRIHNNGNFEGYFFNIEGFYYAEGNWVVLADSRTRPFKNYTSTSVKFTITKRTPPTESYDVEMAYFNNELVDEWNTSQDIVRYRLLKK